MQKLLFIVFAYNAHQLNLFPIIGKVAFNTHALQAMGNILCIWPAKIAFGKTQVVQCIKQVCFAAAVAAANAHYAFIKAKLLPGVIAKLCYYNAVEKKHWAAI